VKKKSKREKGTTGVVGIRHVHREPTLHAALLPVLPLLFHPFLLLLLSPFFTTFIHFSPSRYI
jgi:hypothetical protein